MNRTLVLCAVAALTVALSPRVGWSIDDNPTVADAAIDLSVPDSPGFTALGLGPNMVERPGSPREFAMSLLHGVDTNGNVQSGMSVEVAPSLWYRGQETSLREYQERYFLRFLSRTLLSFAVIHGDSAEDEGTRFALGLRFTPWDEGDPRMDEDLSVCLRDAVLGVQIDIRRRAEAVLNEQNVLQKQKAFVERKIEDEKQRTDREKLDALKDILSDLDRKMKELEKQRAELITMNFSELNERSAAAITVCRRKKDHRERLWSRSSWSLGVVPTFTSSTGTADDLKSSGTALWTSFAFDLGDFGQLILHARYRSDEKTPDPFGPGRLIEQDSFRAGGRVRFGGPDLNFNIEGVHITEHRPDYRSDDKKIQYGAGLEHKIADDLWFVFTIGSEEYDNKDDNLVVLANLRWAHTPAPAKKF